MEIPSRAGVLSSMRSTRPAPARRKPCTLRVALDLELDLLPLYVCTARVTVKERSPDGAAVRSGLRTRVRGSLSARRGRGERRGSERTCASESSGIRREVEWFSRC